MVIGNAVNGITTPCATTVSCTRNVCAVKNPLKGPLSLRNSMNYLNFMPTSLLSLSSNHQKWNSLLSPDVKENAMIFTMGMSIHLTERKIQE